MATDKQIDLIYSLYEQLESPLSIVDLVDRVIRRQINYLDELNEDEVNKFIDFCQSAKKSIEQSKNKIIRSIYASFYRLGWFGPTAPRLEKSEKINEFLKNRASFADRKIGELTRKELLKIQRQLRAIEATYQENKKNATINFYGLLKTKTV